LKRGGVARRGAKTTVLPVAMVCGAGCVVITGDAVTTGLTVSIATLLVAEPAEFVAFTE